MRGPHVVRRGARVVLGGRLRGGHGCAPRHLLLLGRLFRPHLSLLRFRTLLLICNYVILTFIFLGRFVVISLLLWSSVIPAGIEVPEIAQWCFLSSLGRMG